jgi:hypothetical protein
LETDDSNKLVVLSTPKRECCSKLEVPLVIPDAKARGE